MKLYKNFLFLLLVFTYVVSCISNTSEVVKSEMIEKEYNFGEITMTDSIIHTFYLKNTSSTPLKISEVGTSCGCTTTNFTKTEVGKSEMASIEVVFKPEQQGIIDKSIVVEANTDPPFNVFYLKGEVK